MVRGVRDVEPAAIGAYDVVVIGAPTHAFSLSRPSTRADAVRQGADPGRGVIGLREWLEEVRSLQRGDGPLVAIFDSKVAKARRWPGSAARSAARSGAGGPA